MAGADCIGLAGAALKTGLTWALTIGADIFGTAAFADSAAYFAFSAAAIYSFYF